MLGLLLAAPQFPVAVAAKATCNGRAGASAAKAASSSPSLMRLPILTPLESEGLTVTEVTTQLCVCGRPFRQYLAVSGKLAAQRPGPSSESSIIPRAHLRAQGATILSVLHREGIAAPHLLLTRLPRAQILSYQSEREMAVGQPQKASTVAVQRSQLSEYKLAKAVFWGICQTRIPPSSQYPCPMHGSRRTEPCMRLFWR